MSAASNYTIHRKHHNFAWSRDFARVSSTADDD